MSTGQQITRCSAGAPALSKCTILMTSNPLSIQNILDTMGDARTRFFRQYRKHVPHLVAIAVILAVLVFFAGCSRSFKAGPTSSTMLLERPLRAVVVFPDLQLFPDDIKEMVASDNEPDTELVLVEPTSHLQSTFYVADPGRPNGIVEYITTQHDGEKAVTEVFHHILRKTACGVHDNAVVLDIGANTGFYSMLALAEGCQRVLLFEPQPACIRDITHALVRNGFEDRASVVPYFVDVRSGRSVELEVDRLCSGRWPIGQLEDATYRPKSTRTMTTLGISDVIPPGTRIVHAKVDTEGAEYYVLLAMLPYIANGMVDSVIFEMTPIWWVHYGLADRSVVIDQFVTLVTRYGMHCRVLLSAPWYENKLFTKENATALANEIGETYQTDFWFFKPGLGTA